MPTVAKYDIVTGETQAVVPKEGERREVPLETPGIRTDIRALLSYMVDVDKSVTFKIMVVNSKGINYTHPLGEIGRYRALSGEWVRQAVIPAGVLEKSGNTLGIEVTDGKGVFTDIVLWYQTDV